MQYLFWAIERRNERPAPAAQPIETYAMVSLPATTLTGQPEIMTCVQSEEYRNWNEDYDLPAPLRHAYEGLPGYWRRFCDAEQFETLGIYMGSNRFDLCPVCEQRSNQRAADWLEAHAQWGE